MARINLARRAQNGLRRRAKSRSQLVQAARALLSIRPADAITVEEVTGNAGSAKGTVYFHFESLDDLRAAVAEDLTCEFNESSSALSHGHRRPGRTDCNRLPGIRQPGIARSCVGRTYRAGDLGISTCRKGDYSRRVRILMVPSNRNAWGQSRSRSDLTLWLASSCRQCDQPVVKSCRRGMCL